MKSQWMRQDELEQKIVRQPTHPAQMRSTNDKMYEVARLSDGSVALRTFRRIANPKLRLLHSLAFFGTIAVAVVAGVLAFVIRSPAWLLVIGIWTMVIGVLVVLGFRSFPRRVRGPLVDEQVIRPEDQPKEVVFPPGKQKK